MSDAPRVSIRAAAHEAARTLHDTLRRLHAIDPWSSHLNLLIDTLEDFGRACAQDAVRAATAPDPATIEARDRAAAAQFAGPCIYQGNPYTAECRSDVTLQQCKPCAYYARALVVLTRMRAEAPDPATKERR